MAKGKYGKRRSGLKPLAILLALVLLVGGSIGGTLAWLTAKTGPVENTFTVGDVDIELTETEEEYKMVPGHTIHKDPLVTIEAGSEDCWVFVKVEESKNLKEYISYEVDTSNWTLLMKGENGLLPTEAVYYCYAKDITADYNIKVLKDDQVSVLETVTKQMMDSISGPNGARPTLTFTAYAVQYFKTNGDAFTPAEAWEKVNP